MKSLGSRRQIEVTRNAVSEDAVSEDAVSEI